MVYGKLLTLSQPKGANAKSAVLTMPGMKVARAFLAALYERQAKPEFLCTDMCPSSQDCFHLSMPGSCTVEQLLSVLKKFCPEISFDDLDAVVNIDECTDRLHKLMGGSVGRLMIENARDQIKNRQAEHGVDGALTAWREKMDALDGITDAKEAVVCLRDIDAIADKQRSATLTKLQDGVVKEQEARLKRLHMSVASLPMQMLKPLMDLCLRPDFFQGSLEKVISALEDVDKFDGTDFQNYIQERVDKKPLENACKRRKVQDDKHWSEIKTMFADCVFYKSATLDLISWATLYKFAAQAVVTSEQREAWEKLGRNGGKFWEKVNLEGWQAFTGRIVHPYAEWADKLGEEKIIEVAKSWEHLMKQVQLVAGKDCEGFQMGPGRSIAELAQCREDLKAFKWVIVQSEVSSRFAGTLNIIAEFVDKYLMMVSQQD